MQRTTPIRGGALTLSVLALVMGLFTQEAPARTDADWSDLLSRAEAAKESADRDSALVLGRLAWNAALKPPAACDSVMAVLSQKMAGYHYNLGAYDSSEHYLRRGLALREKLYGEDHLLTAESLYRLANVLDLSGKPDEADSLFQRTLAVRIDLLGPNHPDVAKTLNGLAILALNRDSLHVAEELWQRALSIFETAFEPSHPHIAYIQTNLMIAAMRRGKYGLALEMGHEVLRSLHDDPKLIFALTHVAAIEIARGRHSEAEAFLKRAITIAEDTYGRDHPEAAATLFTLGDLYGRLGRNSEAEDLFRRYLTIKERSYGEEHPEVGPALVKLAGLYLSQGDSSRVEPLYQRALRIYRRYAASEHQSIARWLENFSWQFRGYDTRTSLELARRAFEIRWKNARSYAWLYSEEDALRYAMFMRFAASNLASCWLGAGKPADLGAAEIANVVFTAKGQITDIMLDRQRRATSVTDSVMVMLTDSLREAGEELTRCFMEGSDPDDAGVYQSRLDSLNDRKDRLEVALARRNAPFAHGQQLGETTTSELVSALPADACLVEYARYQYVYADYESSRFGYVRGSSDYRRQHYLAVLLSPDEQVEIVDLGEADPIDSAVTAYRQHMLETAHQSEPAGSEGDKRYREIAKRLYDLVWEPIKPFFGKTRTIFVAPDAALNLVAFASLVGPTGRYLVEDYSLHGLSAARDLLRSPSRDKVGSGLLAVGDPDYYATASSRLAAKWSSPSPTAENSAQTLGNTAHSQVRGVRGPCGDPRSVIAGRLLGTQVEVAAVCSLWQRTSQEVVYLCTRQKATEDNFKALAIGRRAIHVATHGFFTPPDCFEEDSTRESGLPEGFVGQNPLLFSGLLLAGCNLHGQGANSIGVDDGFLTAEEVSSLDLRGVQLVTLSACESGLGEMKAGEGVFGLRRALLLAGASTVVSSLWPVSDQTTCQFMAHLYQAREGTIYDVIREHQLYRISRLRSRGYSDHPVRWAAFVTTGDWR